VLKFEFEIDSEEFIDVEIAFNNLCGIANTELI